MSCHLSNTYPYFFYCQTKKEIRIIPEFFRDFFFSKNSYGKLKFDFTKYSYATTFLLYIKHTYVKITNEPIILQIRGVYIVHI